MSLFIPVHFPHSIDFEALYSFYISLLINDKQLEIILFFFSAASLHVGPYDLFLKL